MTMHDERWTLGVAENGDVRLRDQKTGATLHFGGPRGLYNALGQLADWREAVPENGHYVTPEGIRSATGTDPIRSRHRSSPDITVTDDFFEDPDEGPNFGPVFTATYESDCPSCEDPIVPGEDIRADGRGDYIHADTMCERVAREH